MRLGLPAVSRRDRQRKGELMCRVMLGHASMDAPPPPGSATNAGRWLGAPAHDRMGSQRHGWVPGVGERPSVLARERACKLKNDPALAPLGGTTPQRAAPRLATAKRRRAQLGRGTERKGAGVFSLLGECVRACARVHGCVDTCEGACVHMSWPGPWRRSGQRRRRNGRER
jgi:hypothetical protein